MFQIQFHLLQFLFFLPLIGMIILLLINDIKTIKNFSLFLSFLIFILSLFLWIFFDQSITTFQFLFKLKWIHLFPLHFGVDGISLFFIILTTFLIPICLLISYENIKHHVKEFYFLFFLIEFCLLISFTVLDILIFFIFFESILIPMFLMIGLWGSRVRKIKASYLFFICTFSGSLLMFLSIIHIYLTTGTTNFELLYFYSKYNHSYEKYYWLAFFLAFAVKIPIVPFHIWLPEAHVEAPTSGSVLLAGILLKLGVYGILRFLIVLFPKTSFYYMPIVSLFCIISIIYASLTALRQTDLKRIIAYASVAHMNFIILGIFSFTSQGLDGAIIQMISHGLISSGLFILIGCLYDRYHTRYIYYYGGLAQTMPLFSLILFIYTLSNMSIPGSSSFVGELLLLIGIYEMNTITTVFVLIGMFLSGVYSLLFYNNICFGNLKTNFLKIYYDLTYREFLIHFVLIFLIFLIGLYPKSIQSSIYLTNTKYLFHHEIQVLYH